MHTDFTVNKKVLDELVSRIDVDQDAIKLLKKEVKHMKGVAADWETELLDAVAGHNQPLKRKLFLPFQRFILVTNVIFFGECATRCAQNIRCIDVLRQNGAGN
jgi:hypothetical protein